MFGNRQTRFRQGCLSVVPAVYFPPASCRLGMPRNQFGRVPEWPIGADCKSADLRLRGFESLLAHSTNLRVSAGKRKFSNDKPPCTESFSFVGECVVLVQRICVATRLYRQSVHPHWCGELRRAFRNLYRRHARAIYRKSPRVPSGPRQIVNEPLRAALWTCRQAFPPRVKPRSTFLGAGSGLRDGPIRASCNCLANDSLDLA